jgi:hypothetical protein
MVLECVPHSASKRVKEALVACIGGALMREGQDPGAILAQIRKEYRVGGPVVAGYGNALHERYVRNREALFKTPPSTVR